MLTFFRKIRQQLLLENKLSRYLIYAFGEILLVMIGILLALQVNNWNELNQRKNTEQKMLEELLVNLRADSVDNSINIKWYERTAQSAQIIVETLESKTPWHDSLATHYGNIFTFGISTLNKSAYENLKSIGFNLISNDSIRIALTDLYSINYELLRKTEQAFTFDNLNQMVLPVLTKRLKMERWFYAVPLNYEALLVDVEFKETVRWRGITMAYVGNTTRDANKRVHRLMRMLEKELDKEN